MISFLTVSQLVYREMWTVDADAATSACFFSGHSRAAPVYPRENTPNHQEASFLEGRMHLTTYVRRNQIQIYGTERGENQDLELRLLSRPFSFLADDVAGRSYASLSSTET